MRGKKGNLRIDAGSKDNVHRPVSQPSIRDIYRGVEDQHLNVPFLCSKEIVVKKGRGGVGGVCIGRIPLMLRCDRCRGTLKWF